MIVSRESTTIASKDICWLDFTKLGRDDPYMALFNNCSNGFGRCISRSHRLKIDI